MSAVFANLVAQLNKFNLHQNPGTAVMAIQNNEIILCECNGLKNLQDVTAILPSSNFNLASLSKAFTGAAIAILEEQSLIKSSSRLSSFFKTSATYKDIRITDLIHHLSGLPNYAKRHWDNKQLITNDIIVNYLLHDELKTIPGSLFHYNDTNYILLACLIEKVTSMAYSQFLEKTIFNPCMMANTCVYLPDVIISERVIGYSEWPFFDINDAHPGDLVYGDGAIYSSLNDLGRWVMALENATLFTRLTKEKIFSGYSQSETQENYGYGWFIERYQNELMYSHSGEWVGFRNYIANLPEKKLWVIVLSNSSGINPMTIANKILGVIS